MSHVCGYFFNHKANFKKFSYWHSSSSDNHVLYCTFVDNILNELLWTYFTYLTLLSRSLHNLPHWVLNGPKSCVQSGAQPITQNSIQSWAQCGEYKVGTGRSVTWVSQHAAVCLVLSCWEVADHLFNCITNCSHQRCKQCHHITHNY